MSPKKRADTETQQQYPCRGKLMTKPKIDSQKPIIKKLKKYADKDFKNILVKMINEKKSLNEACKEAGMPHPGVVSKYAKKNAELRKELEMTYEQLPNSVQTGADRLSEKKLKEDILRLKRGGVTAAEMLRRTEVSKSMIDNRLNTTSAKASDEAWKQIELPGNNSREDTHKKVKQHMRQNLFPANQNDIPKHQSNHCGHAHISKYLQTTKATGLTRRNSIKP